MKKYKLGRLMNMDGSIPKSPSAAYVALLDGKPIFTFTADEMDEILSLHLRNAKPSESGL